MSMVQYALGAIGTVSFSCGSYNNKLKLTRSRADGFMGRYEEVWTTNAVFVGPICHVGTYGREFILVCIVYLSI